MFVQYLGEKWNVPGEALALSRFRAAVARRRAVGLLELAWHFWAGGWQYHPQGREALKALENAGAFTVLQFER